MRFKPFLKVFPNSSLKGVLFNLYTGFANPDLSVDSRIIYIKQSKGFLTAIIMRLLHSCFSIAHYVDIHLYGRTLWQDKLP